MAEGTATEGMTTRPSPARPVGVVGAGLVGLAVARQLAEAHVPVVVFEKETAVAQHQSGHNSGVVHAGIYYLPGSAKATLCRRGVELLSAYCVDRGLPWDARGKLVVARDDALPSITYVYLSSDRFLEERYPELADLMRSGYTPAADFTTFVVYRRNR